MIVFRILYFEFFQETNSFNPRICTLEDFRKWKVKRSREIFDIDRAIRCETTGMLDAMENEDIEWVPVIAMWSQSGGPVDASLLDLVISEVREAYASSGPIDAVFGVLHGATQDTREADTDGYIAEQLRKIAGPEAVIALSFDMHANITEKILKNADVCCGYLTYPHRDAYETAYRAARLGLMKLKAHGAFITAAVTLPMIVPASGYTSEDGAFKEVLDLGREYVRSGKLLDFTVFQMQPWLDADPAGSTVTAIAKDPEDAKEAAEYLARALWERRKLFRPELMTIDQVIDRAIANASGKPVVLVNAGDSPNGGAVGDSAAVLRRLLERQEPLRFATLVRDCAAVEKAFSAGVGAETELTFGSSISPSDQLPVTARVRVQSLHEGSYTLEGPINAGLTIHIGRAAVIRIGTCDVLLCEAPGDTGDPQIYRHFGIEPRFYDLIEVKANTSFRLPYSAFASEFCYADVPGCVGTADLLSLPFRRIPHPFYPFEEMDDYQTGTAVIYGGPDRSAGAV